MSFPNLDRETFVPREAPFSKPSRASAGMAFEYTRKFPTPQSSLIQSKVRFVQRRDTVRYYAPWNRKTRMERRVNLNPFPVQEAHL